jgi:hypothetical protein
MPISPAHADAAHDRQSVGRRGIIIDPGSDVVKLPAASHKQVC